VLVPVRMRRLWKRGRQRDPDGPVHVSMNDYEVHRVRDVPKVWYEALRFRSAWPRTEGALGLWVGALSLRRSVSVSVWRGPEDLREFVRSPRHLEIMKRHRTTGDLITTPWTAPRFDKHEIWQQATERFAQRNSAERARPVS
jgi:hypothetical protein